jgi:hypothetical protein
MSVKISGDFAQLRESLASDMKHFGDFVGADEIIFKDNGNSEMMTIVKGKNSFIIKACWNRIEGGFFGYDLSKDMSREEKLKGAFKRCRDSSFKSRGHVAKDWNELEELLFKTP